MKRRSGPKNLPLSIVKPAPGDLRLVQELINTADLRRKTEELVSPRALADWLVARGLIAAGTELTADDLARAIAAREGLRALAAANNGAALDAEAVGRLGRAVGDARFQVIFEPGGRGRFVPASESFDDAFGRLVEIVVAAQISGDWRWLKACGNERCRGVFYDFSANHSGRWCSMRRCGNQAKSRTYRRRQPPYEPSWLK